jgi:hypothetical protein
MSTGKKNQRIGADEMGVKGELFSTDMVKAFLENRKIRTSRPIKPKYGNTHFEHRTDKYGTEFVEMQNDVEGETWGKNSDGSTWHKLRGFIVPKPKYQPGDIMYVRETWQYAYNIDDSTDQCIDSTGRYLYYADGDMPFSYWIDPNTGEHKEKMPWCPSIHMPREAARLFYRVTDVKVQNIADMTEQDAVEDGFVSGAVFTFDGTDYTGLCARDQFMEFWRDTYGADAWMWVYYLEKIGKEEALKDGTDKA